jgi:hypothetical protein
MGRFYSPSGNFEVWDEKPDGYFTLEEWKALHPDPEPPEPTADEKLAALDSQYNADKAELLAAYQTAQVYGDTDTMESLKADLQALDGQYDADYEKIIEEG